MTKKRTSWRNPVQPKTGWTDVEQSNFMYDEWGDMVKQSGAKKAADSVEPDSGVSNSLWATLFKKAQEDNDGPA